MHVDNPFKSPNVLSLCTGMRGLERGLERAIGDITVSAYVEIEAFVIFNLVKVISTNGKSREQLNPAWVAQLMGTTLEMTFFGCMEMELLNKQRV